jgi:hypothetical protein
VPDSAERRVTLREAAIRLGVSEGAIRKRVARGSISSEMGEDGLCYVYLDGEDARDGRGADGGTDGGADALIAELRDRVRFVEGQLEAERQAHAEARRIIGGLVQRIPELEAPQEPPGGPPSAGAGSGREETPSAGGGAQEGAERVSWWRRVFGG